MQRIAEVLKSSAPKLDPVELEGHIENAGKILRLLTNLVEPMRAFGAQSSLPQPDTAVQQGLVSVLQQLLQNIANVLSPDASDSVPPSVRLTSVTIFLARVLQFYLGFPGIWTQWMKDYCDKLSKTLSKLIVVCFYLKIVALAYPYIAALRLRRGNRHSNFLPAFGYSLLLIRWCVYYAVSAS